MAKGIFPPLDCQRCVPIPRWPNVHFYISLQKVHSRFIAQVHFHLWKVKGAFPPFATRGTVPIWRVNIIEVVICTVPMYMYILNGYSSAENRKNGQNFCKKFDSVNKFPQ